MKNELFDPTDEVAVQWLREVAADTRPKALPHAGQLWWRAEILRRLAHRDALAARAARPALWGLTAVLAALVVALGVVAAAGASGPGSLFGDVGPGWLVGLPLVLLPAVLWALLVTLWQEA